MSIVHDLISLCESLQGETLIKPKDKKELRKLIEDTIGKDGLNCDLNFIDTSLIVDMSRIFQDSKFNGDISKWDTSKVRFMNEMFSDSEFNGDISKWDTSNVTEMTGMFHNSKFNGDISKWNTSKVITMREMFSDSRFNGDISKWNTSEVLNMKNMFMSSVFNQDISKWDTSKVTDMNNMFYNSDFNQDISRWNVSKVVDIEDMFRECPIKEEFKPKFKGGVDKFDSDLIKDIIINSETMKRYKRNKQKINRILKDALSKGEMPKLMDNPEVADALAIAAFDIPESMSAEFDRDTEKFLDDFSRSKNDAPKIYRNLLKEIDPDLELACDIVDKFGY